MTTATIFNTQVEDVQPSRTCAYCNYPRTLVAIRPADCFTGDYCEDFHPACARCFFEYKAEREAYADGRETDSQQACGLCDEQVSPGPERWLWDFIYTDGKLKAVVLCETHVVELQLRDFIDGKYGRQPAGGCGRCGDFAWGFYYDADASDDAKHLLHICAMCLTADYQREREIEAYAAWRKTPLSERSFNPDVREYRQKDGDGGSIHLDNIIPVRPVDTVQKPNQFPTYDELRAQFGN